MILGASPDVISALKWELEIGQNGKCALCHQPLPKDRRKWALEHSHITGELRGLVDQGCNNIIRWYEQNSEKPTRDKRYGKTGRMKKQLRAYVVRTAAIKESRFRAILAETRYRG